MVKVTFQTGPVEGVVWRPLLFYHDRRGWLCELFRHDELPRSLHPVMSYISMTHPGIARGPHEHVDQTDIFCFLGPSHFKMYVWDNRTASATYRCMEARIVGQDNPMVVIVPPGVVHAYRNVGSEPGIVFNAPNRLYKGERRTAPVDEIRHEEDPTTIFRLD
jgi:dTDP-4-dehydrorhamnose 3,5-epimerase